MTNRTVWSMPKMGLNIYERSDRIWYIMKTRQDNDVTEGTGAVYDENETRLRRD